MKKLNHWVALVTLAAVTVFTACEKKEIGHTMEFPQSSVSEQFFAYDGGVRLLEEVIGFLKEKNDSTEFISGFMDTYGYPVWHDAVYVHHETDSVLGIFVPVHNKQFREIESIWTFRLTPGKIRYYVVERKNVNEEEAKWTFDLFTQEVLGVQPESGNIFKPVDKELVTRSTLFITHCNDIYTGSASGGLTYKYTHCWTEILNIPSFGGGGPIGNGDGDIDSYMYMMPYDGNGGGGGGYSPTPEEVIADKSLDDPQYKNVKDVFDCIVMNAPSDFVKDMLNRFYGKNAEFDITYKVGEMPAGFENATGLCDFSASGYKDGVITFNKNKLNASSLELISTLLHETLRAYIHSWLYSKDPDLEKTTLDEAFNRYEEKLKKGATAAQEHNFMAANWVNTLASELQRFHSTQESYERFWQVMKERGLEVSNRSLFYEAMAWEGLKDTNAYKNLSSDYKTKMNSIYNYDNRSTVSRQWKCK